MKSLWFVVPAHGRFGLTAVCLRQLRRTCDHLADLGVEATAVVIACDENLDTAREVGFGTIERDNQFLSRRFNDGIQLALDPTVNPRPAHYVVPCGSDDWVHPLLFSELPRGDSLIGFQHMSFVNEDGTELTTRFLNYVGGSGIRIFPRSLMEQVDYRPADEDRERGCDTSIYVNLSRYVKHLRVFHITTDPLWLVDWKSPREQLNDYDSIRRRYHSRAAIVDPFDALADVWPQESLDEMASHYGRVAVAA